MIDPDTVGYAAATVTTVSFVPQAWLSWKTRRTAGLSLGMYAIFTLGVALWLGYGLLIGAWPVIFANAITLGLSIPMPWPADDTPPAPASLRLGREPDNDCVVDYPEVSGHHARIVWDGRPGEAFLEDLGSSNGTAIGSPEGRITRSALRPEDMIYLGPHPIPAAPLLAKLDPSLRPRLTFPRLPVVIGRDAACDRVIDSQVVSSRHARTPPLPTLHCPHWAPHLRPSLTGLLKLGPASQLNRC